MSSAIAHPDQAVPVSRDHTASSVHASLWLGTTLAVSLVLYYFVGVDQGATSVFGQDMHVHEFMHDARHFLGYPCH